LIAWLLLPTHQIFIGVVFYKFTTAIYGFLTMGISYGTCLHFAFHIVLFLCLVDIGTILFGEHYFTRDNWKNFTNMKVKLKG
jgi:hypothetical protein